MAQWLQGKTASQKPHETPNGMARRRVEARHPQNAGRNNLTAGRPTVTGCST
jgi:hypothetical protein